MQTEISLIIGFSKTGLFEEFEREIEVQLEEDDVTFTVRPSGNGAHVEVETGRYTEEQITRKIKSIEYVGSVSINEPRKLRQS